MTSPIQLAARTQSRISSATIILMSLRKRVIATAEKENGKKINPAVLKARTMLRAKACRMSADAPRVYLKDR
jgi:hypothetical protein